MRPELLKALTGSGILWNIRIFFKDLRSKALELKNETQVSILSWNSYETCLWEETSYEFSYASIKLRLNYSFHIQRGGTFYSYSNSSFLQFTGTIFVHSYSNSSFLQITGAIFVHSYSISVFLQFTGIIFVHSYPVSGFFQITGIIFFHSWCIS